MQKNLRSSNVLGLEFMLKKEKITFEGGDGTLALH